MKNKLFDIANMPKYGYAVDLSKSLSVTPERHSGFFVPQICIGSQSMHEIHGTSVSATQTRLYTLYEGMTSQNKSAMANMWGESKTSRVNPLTIISQVMANLKTQNVLGGNHA
ncbi:hypothetical protein D7V64_10370 [Acinetobacter cumulans]|jgi:anthranilate/para-aminobenzoate synthase component II|uniref:Uncharacterized protein n=1 Tax=Acinetobacter cumulans TaxID=2136182 RepID=A0A3A8FZB8_9GAMM|nr:hypothetical protein [Acinetobacter cumulans]RKG52227.1 hypothetical protein D7V64_10370 [Acinetobacter cumulans]